MDKHFEWTTVTPESQRMSSTSLGKLSTSLAERGTRSFLVIRNDKIVFEWYVANQGISKVHYTVSLAKALVGGLSLLLALNDSLISPDDLAYKYIPQWEDHPTKSKITIRHLATHTSGIEDAELSISDQADAKAKGHTISEQHMTLPGWKGAFWRREPDPFTISRDQAPLKFEPGTQYSYSNPGMGMLAYAVTAALKGSSTPDIRTLLRERIMQPIGLNEAEWSIGYGQTYTVDGLQLVPNWGGGQFTARAVARVARLLLRQGNWEGKQLIDHDYVNQMLAYAGMPLPVRSDSQPQPASGLCWYTNFDGVWPTLPRDAFAGAGAGHQVLLVIPCRNLVMVRNGERLSDEKEGIETFWGALVKYLFTPLMDTFLDSLPEDYSSAPYPRSRVIRDIAFVPPSNITRAAFDSDNWPLTWGKDDNLYAAYGDGQGFQPYTEHKLGLGFARIKGPPGEFQGINVRSSSGENTGMGKAGAKASGMLMVNGLLYIWVRNVDNSQLAWSADRGVSWQWSQWQFSESFGHPTFLNFGPNYAKSRDDYVYIYSHDADSAYVPADRMVLARVPKDEILSRSAYEFFRQLDTAGNPIWVSDIRQKGAVFVHPGHCCRSGVSYNAGIDRYLWWMQLYEDKADTRFSGGFGIYDAPEPWGPWTTAYFTREWDCGPGEMGSFPPKWMSTDGKMCHLVFSGNDYFSVRKTNILLK